MASRAEMRCGMDYKRSDEKIEGQRRRRVGEGARAVGGEGRSLQHEMVQRAV